jgi:hypothetical protein
MKISSLRGLESRRTESVRKPEPRFPYRPAETPLDSDGLPGKLSRVAEYLMGGVAGNCPLDMIEQRGPGPPPRRDALQGTSPEPRCPECPLIRKASNLVCCVLGLHLGWGRGHSLAWAWSVFTRHTVLAAGPTCMHPRGGARFRGDIRCTLTPWARISAPGKRLVCWRVASSAYVWQMWRYADIPDQRLSMAQ